MHHDGSLLTDSSVTLSADVAQITFGDPATLSGVLTSGDLSSPFEPVTLQQMTAAPGVFETVTTLTTGPDGAFTAKVWPLELTTYRVLWMGAESATRSADPRGPMSLSPCARW